MERDRPIGLRVQVRLLWWRRTRLLSRSAGHPSSGLSVELVRLFPGAARPPAAKRRRRRIRGRLGDAPGLSDCWFSKHWVNGSLGMPSGGCRTKDLS